RHPIRSDLTLLHGLEQGRLCLRAGAVDLVTHDDVGEDRARFELELPPVPVIDADAGDVRGQQVGSELDPVERAVDRPRDGFGEMGLPDPGDVLHENMALGDESQQHELDDLAFALDDGLHVGGDSVETLSEALDSIGQAATSAGDFSATVPRNRFSWG